MEWLDIDRLEILVLAATLLATGLALCGLFLARGAVLRIGALLLFGGLAVGGVVYESYLRDAQRTDCNQVWLLDQRVPVPHCPAASPT